MYKNIGKKIKIMSIAICIIGSIAAFVTASHFQIGHGITIIILGIVLSWIASLPLYGLGELIEMTTEILRNTSNLPNEPENVKTNEPENVEIGDYEKRNKLGFLRAQGLITREEYLKETSKEPKDTL